MTEQRKQLDVFYRNDDKPLLVCEARKDIDLFNQLRQSLPSRPDILMLVHTLPEGREVVLSKGVGPLTQYLSVLNGDWSGARRQCNQYKLGKLFGYTDSECQVFIEDWTPEYCQCSKCVWL